jgi:hypothetical protein
MPPNHRVGVFEATVPRDCLNLPHPPPRVPPLCRGMTLVNSIALSFWKIVFIERIVYLRSVRRRTGGFAAEWGMYRRDSSEPGSDKHSHVTRIYASTHTV